MKYILPILFLSTVWLSATVSAAPNLVYSTMVVDSAWHSDSEPVADVDVDGNLYIAVSSPSGGRWAIRIYRVNAAGSDVAFVAELAGVRYYEQISCHESGIYVRVYRDGRQQILKLTPAGDILYTLELLGYPEKHFVDSEGNLYVGLDISSQEDAALVQVTGDALDPEYNGSHDIVLQKYDPDGTLLYCSFLGGSGADEIIDMAIDDDGCWYLYIGTISLDFPYPDAGNSQELLLIVSPCTTEVRSYTRRSLVEHVWYESNALYEVYSGNVYKYNKSHELLWSMEFHDDVPRFGVEPPDPSRDVASIVTDGSQIYTIRHVTYWSPFTVTPDAFRDTVRGNDYDLGIWQISDSAELLYGTYFGGVGEENTAMNAVACHDGKLYVAGYTKSSDFPLTPGAYIDARDPDMYPTWGLFAFCLDFNESTEVAAETSSIPEALILDPPHPNPFNPATTIVFTLPETGFARLAVYDISGQMVRELAAEPFPAGRHEIVWDGRDATGAAVSSGIYIARLAAGDRTAVRKVTLVR